MPKRDKNERIAPRLRQNTAAGKARHQAICGPGQETAAPAGIIADSFHGLTLPVKPGAEVFAAREGFQSIEGGPELICSDLWLAYKRARKIFKGEAPKINPFDLTPMPFALGYILEEMKKILPVGWQFNISYSDAKGHHFVVYKDCPWHFGWTCMPIKKVVGLLRKENRSLHDLFICFLSALRLQGGVCIWIDGYGDNIICDMDDRLEQMSEDGDSEDVERAAKEIASYKKGGEAHKYASLILNAARMPAAELRKRAQRFRKCGPIANLIYQGAGLLQQGFRLENYDALAMMDEEDMGYYLPLDEQCSILWDDDDFFTNEMCYYLDSMANEGVQEPVHTAIIDKKTRTLDIERFEQGVQWPSELSEFFDRANELIKDYINERPNASIDETVQARAGHYRI